MPQAHTQMCSLTREESPAAWLWQVHIPLQGLQVQEGLRILFVLQFQFNAYKNHIIATSSSTASNSIAF